VTATDYGVVSELWNPNQPSSLIGLKQDGRTDSACPDYLNTKRGPFIFSLGIEPHFGWD
jgi:hypothetical protein